MVDEASDGDEILIGQGDEESRVYNISLSSVLDKILHFKGVSEAEPPTLSCWSGSSEAVLDISRGASFANIILDSCSLVMHNANVRFENCTMKNSPVYVMGSESFAFGARDEASNNSEMHEILSFMEKAFVDEDYWLQCMDANVTFAKTTWMYEHNISAISSPGVTVIDGIIRNGIHVVCDTATINIFDSFLAENLVVMSTLRSGKLNMANSVFRGTVNGTIGQGGIKVFAFASPQISIDNCTFDHLMYSDTFLPILHEHSQMFVNRAGAIVVQLISTDTMSSNIQSPGLLNITDSVFNKNFGALTVRVMGDKPHHNKLNVSIRGSTFSSNYNLGYGGALSLVHGIDQIKIERTTFTKNTVGSLSNARLYVGRQYRASSTLFTLNEFKMSRGNRGIEMDVSVGNCSEDLRQCDRGEPRHIALSFIGSGGAIALEEEGSLVIESCQFLNDMSATGLGDAFHLGANTAYSINDTFVKTKAVPFKRGFTLYASAERGSRLTNTRFEATSQHGIPLGQLYHNTKSLQSNLLARNISITCGVSSWFYWVNQTNKDPFGPQEVSEKTRATNLLEFIDLMYFCSQCPKDTYSLQGERLTIDVRNGKELISHEKTTCQPCPYGGLCPAGKVLPKPNMWGQVEGMKIKMYLCPGGYCCSNNENCLKYDTCAPNRTSVLCGHCNEGYSEALFSPNCIPNDKCSLSSFLIMLFGFGITYVVVFLFQKDFKDFLFGPLKRKHKRSNQNQKTSLTLSVSVVEEGGPSGGFTSLASESPSGTDGQVAKLDEGHDNGVVESPMVNGKQSDPPVTDSVEETTAPEETEEAAAKDGIFLILLFYYFQDAAVVYINTVYLNRDGSTEGSLKEIIGGLFQFRLDLFSLLDDICAIPNFTPIDKILFRMSFVVMVFCLCLVVCICLKLGEWICCLNVSNIRTKLVIATMFTVLFSFQSIISTLLKLIQCVTLGDTNVLLIDANHQCFTSWQIGICVYLSTCFIPFTLYMTFFPVVLRSNRLSPSAFLIGCLVPLPVTLYCLFCRKPNTSKTSKSSKALYNLLQGPFKDLEYRIPCTEKTVFVCWGGLYLVRRLMLVLLQVFVQNVLIRLSIMTFLSLFSLFHHMIIWPCKDHRANMSSFVSALALVIICILNTIKATFEVAEHVPIGVNQNTINALRIIEDLLILWIPVSGILIILLVLIKRILTKVWYACIR